MDFVKLFQPITINGLGIKNRIVMPAMGLAYTSDYTFNDRYRGFYRERAEGGVGLMTIGPVAIDKVGSAPFLPGLFDDQYIEPLREFNDELHKTTDVKTATQLMHMGRYAFSFFTGTDPLAPSPIPSRMTRDQKPREMTLDHIEEVQEAYAQTARRAKEAGFDYVEVLACTGYLLSQFLSPITNIRTDDYGGSLENRMRFPLEVIRRVRAAVGPEMAMGIRIAGNEFMEGGNTNKESSLFAAEAEKAGADAVNVTGGWHETYVPQLTTNVPPGCFLYLARGIKEGVGVPVFASNRLGDPHVAERALRSGACDMVCWGRPLIADPGLPNKVREGRFDEILPCISCNQGCFDSIFSGTSVHCVLNPRAGRENELKVETTTAPKKVLVAGGGPAGMEFALTAARAGHEVTLCEKEGMLGGQINLAKAPPGKQELGTIIESMSSRMKHWGVRVELEIPVTPEEVDKRNPDVLVVASGARPMEIKVPGIDKPHVVSAWDVLMERVPDIGKNVVIVGGSATGCETAHFLASMGASEPAIFTFLMYHTAEHPETARELLHSAGRTISVIDMVGRLADNVGRTSRWCLMKSLKLMGVDLRPSNRLLEITDDAVVVETDKGTESIPADTVIIAVGAVPEDDLTRRVQQNGVRVITIGDAKEPRKIVDAVREGFEAALKI